jgi:predicted enzyme involved in methoxymalonyl-ACP biosynthesis
MSCRVLKRGMEKFVLNQIAQQASKIGVKKIIGEYLPTAKNGLVKGHYNELGFTKCDGEDNLWILNLESYSDYSTFISLKTTDIKKSV